MSSAARPALSGVARADGLRLAVVEVVRHRPWAPDYDAYAQSLVGRVLEVAAEAGWQADRHAAGDLGTDALLRATDLADAVVVVGGEDIAPHRYGGGAGYPGEGRHDDVADVAQIALVRRAVARRTPLLGICRGLQVVNVALGGGLVQHLHDDGGLHRGSGPADRLMVDHDVELVRGTRLAALLGPGRTTVRSAHHQAVGRVGDGLRVSAHASDGSVEALEHATAPVVGVQWHPEDRGAERGQLPLLVGDLAVSARSLVVAA